MERSKMETLLPKALIKKRKRSVLLTKYGRGFSHNELSKAGISLDIARKASFRIDLRRRSANEENIEMLKEWFKKMGKSELKKLKSKPKQKMVVSSNNQRGRASRGLTSAGKKGRGLMKARGISGTHKHRLRRNLKNR